MIITITNNPRILYYAAALGFFRNTSNVTIRSSLSKLSSSSSSSSSPNPSSSPSPTTTTSVGSLFSLLAAIEALTPLVSAPLVGLLYTASLSWYFTA